MKVVRMYAGVLFDSVSLPGAGLNLEKVLEELEPFAKAAEESPIFLKVFDNPTMGEEEKQKAFQALENKNKISPFSNRFLAILIKRNRVGLLADVLKAVRSIQIEKSGGLTGELASATPVDAKTITEIAEGLSKKLQKKVQLKEKIDPNLMAGMRVTVGGVTYDGSVKAKLDRLAEMFQN